MYVPHINAMNEADEDYHREVTAEIRNVGLETMRSVERLERAMLDQRAEDMARNIAGRMQPIIPSQRAQIKTRRQLVWATYEGNWSEVYKILDEAENVYGQWWINCTKPAIVGNDYVPSGYTPLHQAAWHGVFCQEVEVLL
ncbi:hypothetical protein FPQ18DRAFT_309123 [Pyronema domesticum]|nr:hypothetical protein FPQ18DRAFT_309123 [Pyronema domesticum]